MGMLPRTDTQTRVTSIRFASSTTHAKCNNSCSPVANHSCPYDRQDDRSSLPELNERRVIFTCMTGRMIGLHESNERRVTFTCMTGRMMGLPESNEGRVTFTCMTGR